MDFGSSAFPGETGFHLTFDKSYMVMELNGYGEISLSESESLCFC